MNRRSAGMRSRNWPTSQNPLRQFLDPLIRHLPACMACAGRESRSPAQSHVCVSAQGGRPEPLRGVYPERSRRAQDTLGRRIIAIFPAPPFGSKKLVLCPRNSEPPFCAPPFRQTPLPKPVMDETILLSSVSAARKQDQCNGRYRQMLPGLHKAMRSAEHGTGVRPFP